MISNNSANVYFQVIFEFPAAACCPILDIESFPRLEYRSGKCFTDRANSEWFWSTNSFFFLDGEHGTVLTCKKENSSHICTGKINDLLIEPKIMRFTLGYLCDSLERKSLKGFKYYFKWLQLRNSTSCRPMKYDSLASGFLQCTKYYKYTALPNFYGAGSQEEVLNTLTIITSTLSTSTFQTSGGMCHKDIEYLICQAFFPHCPVNNYDGNKTGKYIFLILQVTTPQVITPCTDDYYKHDKGVSFSNGN